MATNRLPAFEKFIQDIRAAWAALPVQAGCDFVGADVAAADLADGVRGVACVAHQVGQVCDSVADGASGHCDWGARVCAAGD